MDERSYTLDRFEGEYAIIVDDDANSFDIPRGLIPPGAKEGDTIRCDGYAFTIDREHTNKRYEDIRSRFERLKKK